MADLSTRTLKRLRNWTLALVAVLLPIMAVATFIAIEDVANARMTARLALTLIGDLVLVLVVIVLIVLQAVRKLVGRRETSVESPILLRLSRLFAFVALFPAIAVAVAATLTISVGLGDVLRLVISETLDKSRGAAESYVQEESSKLGQSVVALARFINDDVGFQNAINLENLRPTLQARQIELVRKVEFAFLIDGSCNVVARGNNSYLFDYVPPPEDLVASIMPADAGLSPDNDCDRTLARSGPDFGFSKFIGLGNDRQGAIYRRTGSNIFSAVHRIGEQPDLFLVAANEVTIPIVELYDLLKPGTFGTPGTAERLARAFILYLLLYLGITLVILIAMVRLGIAFARRISRPIEELASVAQSIEGGKMDVVSRVSGNDEVAMLGRTFNEMVARLRHYTDNLIELREEAVRREQSFSSVLSNVTAGVIGLDRDENIVFMNRSAAEVLGLQHEGFNEIDDGYAPHRFGDTVTDFAGMLLELKQSTQVQVQGPVDIDRQGLPRHLHVRIARRLGVSDVEGYVVAFDDVSELVWAKNRAAWSEVAQGIAHEIRNPLTPVMSAVQQLESKVDTVESEGLRNTFNKYLGIIQRNMKSLVRLSQEFSAFGQMKNPSPIPGNVCKAVELAVMTESERRKGIAVSTDFDKPVIEARFDQELFHLALINLLKNAGEAVEQYKQSQDCSDDFKPEIRVAVMDSGSMAEVRIMDNGPGFPDEKENCLRPFHSTKRDHGSGLGLPNVARVIAGHGGTLTLEDAPVFEGSSHSGAMVIVRIPATVARPVEAASEPASSISGFMQ